MTEEIDIRTKSKETSDTDVSDVFQSRFEVTEKELQSVAILQLSPGHFNVKAFQTVINKVRQLRKKAPSGWTVKIIKVPITGATASLPPSLPPITIRCSSVLTNTCDPILVDVTTYSPVPSWMNLTANTDDFTQTFYENIKTHVSMSAGRETGK